MSFLAWIFGLVVWIRNGCFNWGLFRAKRLPGRVISVGNIAVGGTGKSPMIIAIAEFFVGRGAYPVILTRGYRGGLSRQHWMCLINGERVAGNAPAEARPDEAFMQSKILKDVPVVVGSRRAWAAQQWLDHSLGKTRQPTHWLIDDGFQHRWLARDVDIVLLDAKRPYGALMPKGRFREPTESLGRAHVVVFTRSTKTHPRPGDSSYVTLIAPNALCGRSEMTYEALCCVCEGEGQLEQGAWLVAGIAQPQAFAAAVRDQGAVTVLGEVFVDDHEPFRLEELRQKLPSQGGVVLTTEKDWARSESILRGLNRSVYVLPMRASLPKEIVAVLSR